MISNSSKTLPVGLETPPKLEVVGPWNVGPAPPWTAVEGGVFVAVVGYTVEEGEANAADVEGKVADVGENALTVGLVIP